MAADHLRKAGYTLRHRNWRSGRKELDIVAEKGEHLIVVEVKTRRNEDFGPAEEALSPMKIRRIVAATDAYLRKFAIDLPVRFDLITVTGDETDRLQLEHIERAFLPPVW